MASLAINRILEKMTGKDKDCRYMATSDLLNELKKDSFKPEPDSDFVVKLTNIVLQQFDDAARDVSGLAVKCLIPLVKKVNEDRVLEMTSKLCDKLLIGSGKHRDIYSIGLKTIVSEVNSTSLAQRILTSLGPHLMKGITISGKITEIKCECLDILADVLHRFGNLSTKDHEETLAVLLSQLSSNQATVRNKSVRCIASLASSLSDGLLTKTTFEVVKLLKIKNTKPELTRTNIQMIGALSRSVGHRFGPHLSETVPLLINYCTNASEADEELQEYSLQALENFLLRCPTDISSYCDDILNLSLEYISFDPNFADIMEEDADNKGNEQEEEDESANDHTDDEDSSWKVRRASAKCLAAIIVSQPEMLTKLYYEACHKLIERFKEREESVKMDIFNTFIELLRQTGNLTKGQLDIDESSPCWLLKEQVPKIVKSINRQLREKSIKTKVGAFSVLRELVVVLPDCLSEHIGTFVSGIEKALNEKSSTSNLKIEALVFTRLVMSSCSPSIFRPYIKALSAPVVSAVGERYYKVTSEALRVCGELIRVLRLNFELSNINFKSYVGPIYNAIMTRLASQDQHQEVKECAISCMSLVISTFGDIFQRELSICLSILVDRMGNEITQLTTVKAFAVIANSPLCIDISCVLDQVILELTTFLRKANRALRQATLGTLKSIVVTYGKQIGSSFYETIIVEISTLVSDTDLNVTALALELCCLMMSGQSSSQKIGMTVRQKVLPQALVLIRSSLLQGQALQALKNFFASLVHLENTSFHVLLNSLLSSAKPPSQYGGLSKQALSSIAQCVAVLCLEAGIIKCKSTVELLKGILKDGINTNSFKQHVALLCLGEIGWRTDLSMHVWIENIVIESFKSPFEEIKFAASYALGNIAVRNLSKYLPFILDQIDNQREKQYLLLHSLKEVIARQIIGRSGQRKFQESNVEKILNLLFSHCGSDEEGVRDVVAECLGKMALIEPRRLVPALKVRTASPTAFIRATVVVAVKYSIVERSESVDEILFSEISTFLMLIMDGDRHVRRAAVLALCTAAHNKPNLIKGLLPDLLPLLYDQTVIKQELIRTVDLGPFKHVVDDGLELRKAAFECVHALLDNCLDQVNPSSFIVPFLISGLSDHYDVKMSCHLILSKLADKCPSAVLAVLNSLANPLEKTIYYIPKADSVRQEVDRNEDMIRSALRAIVSLSRISGGDCNLRLKMMINNIRNSASLSVKYYSVCSEPLQMQVHPA